MQSSENQNVLCGLHWGWGRVGGMCTWDGVDGAQQLLHVGEVQALVFQGRLRGDFHVCFCFQEFSESVGVNSTLVRTEGQPPMVQLLCRATRNT